MLLRLRFSVSKSPPTVDPPIWMSRNSGNLPSSQSTQANYIPPPAIVSARVKNVGQKRLCCRKGCLKCVDTPSFRERTLGMASGKRR